MLRRLVWIWQRTSSWPAWPDCAGRIVERREFNRTGFLTWLGTLPGTVIGMGGLRQRPSLGPHGQRLGLAPRLMAAEFVRPYRKRQSVKNDRADAESDPDRAALGFVPVKTEAPAAPGLHSLRIGWVEGTHRALQPRPRAARRIRLIVDPGPGHLRTLLAEREFDTAPVARAAWRNPERARPARGAGHPDRRMRPADHGPAGGRSPLAKRARDLPGVGSSPPTR